MAKARRKNSRTAMCYTRPGSEAIAEITAILTYRATAIDRQKHS